MSSPQSQGRARQRKQLKPLYASKDLEEGAASETNHLMRPMLRNGSYVTVITHWARADAHCCMATLLWKQEQAEPAEWPDLGMPCSRYRPSREAEKADQEGCQGHHR